jgi:hypothetical protein
LLCTANSGFFDIVFLKSLHVFYKFSWGKFNYENVSCLTQVLEDRLVILQEFLYSSSILKAKLLSVLEEGRGGGAVANSSQPSIARRWLKLPVYWNKVPICVLGI